MGVAIEAMEQLKKKIAAYREEINAERERAEEAERERKVAEEKAEGVRCNHKHQIK